MPQRTYNIDAELIMAKPGTTIAADDVPQDGGVDIVKKVGQSRFEGVLIVNVTALEIASNDELYRIIVQGGLVEDFSTAKENLAILELGATEVRLGGASDSAIGQFEVPFVNEMNDVIYPYIRLNVDVAGSIASGITFGAHVVPKY